VLLLKISQWTKSPLRRKGLRGGVGRVSVNFRYDLLSPLSAHDELVMQALVWLHMVLFRAIQFDTVWLRAPCTNLR